MKGIDALGEFLKSEGMPQGMSNLGANPANGERSLAGKGASSGSGDSSAGSAIGAPAVAEEKLSEDDEKVAAQLKDRAPQPLAKSRSFDHEKALLTQRLQKGRGNEDVVVGVGVPTPDAEEPAELEKSQDWRDNEDSLFRYSNKSDIQAEALLKSEFYHGEAPTLARHDVALFSKAMCKSCNGKMNKMLTACPNCGADQALEKSLTSHDLAKSRAGGLKPAPREGDLFLPNGTKSE